MDKKITKKEETKVDIDLKKDLDPNITVESLSLKRIPTDLFFSQSNMLTYGRCTRSKKPVFGLLKN